MAKRTLSYDTAASLLEIKDGVLQWKTGRAGKRAGTKAGTVKPDGYVSVSILGGFYQAHRVVWLLRHGKWPLTPLDHINGSRSDNRIENLRACSASQNQHNRKVNTENRFGLKGVLPGSTSGRYCARIRHDGKQTHLGTFNSPGLAAHAYDAAASNLFKEFAKPNHSEVAA